MWVRLTALAVTIALLAAVWIPAGAPARDGSIVCDSATASDGRCDARRPAPSIVVRPASPRAGTPVVLSAASPGHGVTFAWDLDADGAFERTGVTVSTVFTAGPHTVAVRATDADGRVGVETRTLEAHAANSRPGGRLRLVTPSPHNATTTELLVGGEDPDGHVTLIEFDVHGDGVYDDAHAFGPGETAYAEHRYPDPIVGRHTTAARITDDAGATAELTTGVEVHAENLPPRVGLVLAPSAPQAGEPVIVSAVAGDPDGEAPGVAFDLDGDGTYEADGPAATLRLDPGTHELGVRAQDADGATTVSRRTVNVHASPFEIVPPPALVRPGAPVTFAASIPGAVWDTDDDGAFDDDPTRAFPIAGVHRVSARAGDGRVAMRTVAVIADHGTAPAVTELDLPLAIQSGRSMTFRAAAVDPDGGPVTLAFELSGDGRFDDRPSAVGDGFRWTFPSAGPLTIAVRATDSTGAASVSRASPTTRRRARSQPAPSGSSTAS